MEFIKKNWVWLIVAILIAYLIYSRKKKKEFEAKAVAAFDKLNSMVAKAKQGAEYTSEKASLVKLLSNASEKEKAVLSDLLGGTIGVFTMADQAKDKEQEKQDFPNQMAKMQSDLVTKHGKASVMSLKAKMDKYGFDI